MAELYRYAAFISYSSKDAKFAQRLHRALESYGIPSSLGKFDLIGGGKKNRIYPVFRDREELSAGNLGAQIEANLKASAALIVVCSPNGAASPWVQKEIEFFAGQGRHAKIFAIIPDTAPLVDDSGADCTQSCFPPAFRGDALSGDKLEPLAADARKGKDGFRNAWIKIVAGMIGVTPGQIIDRDRKRRRQRRTLLVAGGSLSLLLLALAGAWVDARTWRSALTAEAMSQASAGSSRRAATLALAGLSAPGDVLATPRNEADAAAWNSGLGIPTIADFGTRQFDLLFSTDDRFLLARDNDENAWLHDLSDVDREPLPLGALHHQNEAGFAFGGNFLVTRDYDERTFLRDLRNPGAPPRSLAGIGYFLIPGDGRFLLMRSQGLWAESRLLDLNRTEAAPRALGEVLGWTLSPNGRFLLTTSLSDEGELYSLSDLSEPSIALGVTDGVAFSKNGRWMATHARDQPLFLRDLSRLAAPPESLGAGARSYAFSPDDRFLAVVESENNSWLVDLASPATRIELPSANDFSFSRSGRFLLLLRYSPEQSLVLDLSATDLAPRAVGPVDYWESDPFAFSADDRFLLTRAPRADSSGYDLVLHDLSDADGAPIQLGQALRFYSSRLSGDGRFLVTLDESRNATLRDLGAPTVTARPLGQLKEGPGFSFSPDGRFVAVVDHAGDGFLHFTSEDRDPIPLGRVDFATFSSGGRYLVVDNTEVRDLEAVVSLARDGTLRTAMCRSGDAVAPFATAMRASGGQPLSVNRALRGRPWNPCDWRGLLAIFPSAERGDGWFEGARQWLRLVQVRLGGADYACDETTSAASVETRARRRDMCERFAEPASPAPT